MAVATPVTMPSRADAWWVALMSSPTALLPSESAWMTAAHDPIASANAIEAPAVQQPERLAIALDGDGRDDPIRRLLDDRDAHLLVQLAEYDLPHAASVGACLRLPSRRPCHNEFPNDRSLIRSRADRDVVRSHRMAEAFLVGGARTPVGRYGGALAERAARRPRRARRRRGRAPRGHPGCRGRHRRGHPRRREPGRRRQPQRRPHGRAARRACPTRCPASPSTGSAPPG